MILLQGQSIKGHKLSEPICRNSLPVIKCLTRKLSIELATVQLFRAIAGPGIVLVLYAGFPE